MASPETSSAPKPIPVVTPVATMQVEDKEDPTADRPSLVRENHELWDTVKAVIWGMWQKKQTFIIALSIFLYFAVSVVVYSSIEGWDFVECIYFAVVVVTTVGYGDFLPTKDESKIATIILSQIALAVVAFSIGNIVNVVQQTFLQVVKATDQGFGIFNQAERRRRRRMRSYASLSVYLVLVLLGTIVFGLWQDFGEESGSKWVNAVYLTVITMTTIGFGDHSPAETHGMKFFGIFLMIVGIPATVTVLALATETVFGSQRDSISLRVIQGDMTRQKYQGLQKFVEDLREKGVGNYRGQGDGKISRFEYLCFILIQNEVLEFKNIENVMKNFDNLDKTSSGYIEIHDIDGTKSPANMSGANEAERTMSGIARGAEQEI